MAWNHKEQGAPKLTQEFREIFICKIKGKEAILATGLQALAHEKGIKALKPRIIQFPNKDNDNTAIVETTLLGYDWCPVTNQIIEVEYTAIGDANPKNCTAMVAAAFIRMAETRSISRACKNYVNVGIVSVEELSSVVEEQLVMITPQQMNTIADIMKKNGMTKESARSKMLEVCNKSDLRGLTEDEAKTLIAEFKKVSEIAV